MRPENDSAERFLAEPKKGECAFGELSEAIHGNHQVARPVVSAIVTDRKAALALPNGQLRLRGIY